MILYREHRSTLDASMRTLQKFHSVKDMLAHVTKRWYDVTKIHGIASISDDEHVDDRIGWNKFHYVLVDSQCVGMCNLEEAK